MTGAMTSAMTSASHRVKCAIVACAFLAMAVSPFVTWGGVVHALAVYASLAGGALYGAALVMHVHTWSG